ncbi:transposase, partial [Roseovarius sp. D22-M7]|uniref:transposase n=1 Tax=Roseovarius sp. D22-M7 TaxID=3127116 RepID=UPI00300FE1C1
PAGARPGQTPGDVVSLRGPADRDEARVGQQGTLTRIRAPRGTRDTWACIGLHLRRRLRPDRGATAALLMPTAHLAEISRTVAEGAHAVLVLDGAGGHGAKALKVPDTITLLPLPPYAPEFNPLEHVRARLRADPLAISVFKPREKIVARCRDAWNFFANDIATMRAVTTREYAKAIES